LIQITVIIMLLFLHFSLASHFDKSDGGEEGQADREHVRCVIALEAFLYILFVHPPISLPVLLCSVRCRNVMVIINSIFANSEEASAGRQSAATEKRGKNCNVTLYTYIHDDGDCKSMDGKL